MLNKIIIAKNLTKKFKELTAVKEISFTINEGECFAFLGPNGAGKTTIIKMIHCVSNKTSGELYVAGIEANVNKRQVKKIVGVIPQETNLDVDLTVYENLYLFSNFFDLEKKEAKKRIDNLLEFVELSPKKKNKINELSTGMKRRLLIARALINQPKIIIADEPTTGLDPQARHLIWQRLRQLKSQGATMILTTQYMEEAEQLCDRVVIMDKGEILKEGRPRKLIEEEIGKEVIEIQISQDEDKKILEHLKDFQFNHERAGDVFYLYCHDGRILIQKIIELNLAKVFHRPANLEDVFLKLTGRSLIE